MKTEDDIFGFKELDEKILEKLDFQELSDKLDEVEKTSEEHKKYFIEQKELTNQHLLLFQEVLSNLAKDHQELKRQKKNIKCLILSVQVLIGCVLTFAAFVLLHIFHP